MMIPQPANAGVTRSVYVPGEPAPKGSTRSFAHPHTGRIVTLPMSKKTKPWEKTIRQLIGSWKPEDGPVSISLDFRFQRPKSHLDRHGLKKLSAPLTHLQSPDLDKLTRCVLDALTGFAWVDDKQVVKIDAQKRWKNDESGVLIEVKPYYP